MNKPNRAENDIHWLYRKDSRKKLWWILAMILGLALVPEFFVERHAHFASEGIHLDAGWGFYAWFGFGACALMVIIAKVLGFVLKRKDTYYDD